MSCLHYRADAVMAIGRTVHSGQKDHTHTHTHTQSLSFTFEARVVMYGILPIHVSRCQSQKQHRNPSLNNYFIDDLLLTPIF